jgi:hypothetical protein
LLEFTGHGISVEFGLAMDNFSTIQDLRSRSVGDFDDIGGILVELSKREPPRCGSETPLLELAARGTAFVTFAYDIDGVSMEIAKYGAALEQLFAESGHRAFIHIVGGNFAEKANVVFDPAWKRHIIANIDGWSKWEDGKWFSRLFYEDMPAKSAVSGRLASEMWQRAIDIAEQLEKYVLENKIGILIPVNINSNPGNFALALACVLASEVTGCPVLNNNHDYYWEGGKRASERSEDAPRGPRDHFFHNADNGPFFDVLRRIFPWNGRRWIQVNINPLQSRHLIAEDGFEDDRVFLVGTGIDEIFFQPCDPDRRRSYRQGMARILAAGASVPVPRPVEEFAANLADWMADQGPLVCGARAGLRLDLAADESIILLQPTRVVGRKRIERNWELIGALLEQPTFRTAFESNSKMTLTLHVTGPIPIEHQADLNTVLDAYRRVLGSVPDDIACRLFQSFSVGTQSHPSLDHGLSIADIYQMADMIMFPSETEGRGLPIPESAAARIPIVCSRYDPVEVFEEVVGEHLSEEHRIRYLEFPEREFGTDLLESISRMLLDPTAFADRLRHNRDAVRARYSLAGLRRSFTEYLRRLEAFCRE